MSLPSEVKNYLESLLADQIRPFCIKIDRDFLVVEWWGDPGDKGFRDIAVGVDLRGQAPFLYESDLATPAALRFVTMPTGRVFHIHLIPAGGEAFLAFIPAREELNQKKELQQTANEVRLLNHQQRRLMKQLAQSQRELERKKEEAERANLIKSRFIASMSHEFRTPLTSVLGYAELIAEEGRDDGDVTAHAEAVRRGARHLLSMVDNILDQARLEEGNVAIRIAPVNVRRLTDDLTAIMAPLAAEKGLSFGAFIDRDVPEAVRTDEMRLRQILLNLLGNAVKFTDQGEVRLEVSWKEDALDLKIIDTGPGVPESDRERIFEAFHRAAGSEGKRGSGLGLNISMRLIQLLQGDIAVDTRPGEGSRFRVRLPASEAAPVATGDVASLRAPQFDSSDKLVLVAEDDPDLVELIRLFLGRGNYRLALANDGQEAVDLALARKPDLVLMDVNMPVLDGLGATRTLRDRGYKKPIIVLTASLSANDRDYAYSCGCDGYLVKPITMPELLSAVNRFLHV